jgi:hypothetical protein
MMEPTKNPTVEAVEQLVRELGMARKDRDQERLKSNTHYENWRRAVAEVDGLKARLSDTVNSAAANYADAVRFKQERDELRRDYEKVSANCANNAIVAVEFFGKMAQLTSERDAARDALERSAGVIGTNLAEVGRRAHEACFRRGFHKPGQMRSYLKRTAHAMEELNEALIGIEKDRSSFYLDQGNGGKPEGVLTEFADAIIVIAEMAYHYSQSHTPGGMPVPTLDAAVAAKLDYNDRREDGTNGNSV